MKNAEKQAKLSYTGQGRVVAHARDAGNWDSARKSNAGDGGGDGEQPAHEHGWRQAIRQER